MQYLTDTHGAGGPSTFSLATGGTAGTGFSSSLIPGKNPGFSFLLLCFSGAKLKNTSSSTEPSSIPYDEKERVRIQSDLVT